MIYVAQFSRTATSGEYVDTDSQRVVATKLDNAIRTGNTEDSDDGHARSAVCRPRSHEDKV